MKLESFFTLLLILCGFGGFSAASQFRSLAPTPNIQQLEGRVVVAAPVLLMLFGGDRYLSANFETIRIAATGVDWGRVDVNYLARAQLEVAKLNPCHEDNYYLANGLLTWGGADKEGDEVLRRAMDCRFWDEFPPFFYGFNQAFFEKNISEASRGLELAAQRATDNSAGFRKLAIVLRAEDFADEQLALDFIIQQRDSANDPKLRDMLNKRILRLEGLVALRTAQRRYERKYGILNDLQQLVATKELQSLPDDPLRLGYELHRGRIQLKKIEISGLENQP